MLSVGVPATQAPQKSSSSGDCPCTPNVRRIWPLDKDMSVEIRSLAEVVRDTMRVDLVVASKRRTKTSNISPLPTIRSDGPYLSVLEK